MAREYAKLLTRIWADADFKRLTGNAQRLYFQIISQPDLSSVGVVTLAEKRWAMQVADQAETEVVAAVNELVNSRFVVVDHSTQEVLVRSFIRSDGAWKSPTAMKGIDGAARSVLSDCLKAVIRDELGKVDTSVLSGRVSDKTGRSTREYVEGIVWGIKTDFEHLTDTPSDTPTDTPSDTPSPYPIESLHSTTTTPTPTPTPTPTYTPTPTPTYTTRKSGATRKRVGYPEAFETFWNQYPIKRDKGKALKAWEKATERANPDTILNGATRYREDPNRSDQYTKYAEGWLNGDGWEDEPLPTRTGSMTFDQQRINNNNNLFTEINQQIGGDIWTQDSSPKQIGQ